LTVKVSSINNSEFTGVLADFKANSPLVLTGEDVRINNASKTFSDYTIYEVTIQSFSGTFDKVEEFLEYVDNYERIVRVDTINFRKNQITGLMGGSLKLSFYFKRLEE